MKASAERVWQVLTDFDSYAEWNPQIPRITGKAEAGESLKMRLVFPKRPPLNVSAKLDPVSAPRELWWKGHLVASWFFTGERQFSIADGSEGGVMVTHGEHITGAFSPVFELLMGGPVERSHRAVNEALRLRCETPEA